MIGKRPISMTGPRAFGEANPPPRQGSYGRAKLLVT
jgi:hypothetical protein